MSWRTAYFIAKRLKSKQGTAFAATISRIAVGSIALGLGTVLLSSMIFGGFRSAIQEKIFALAGHIQVSKFDLRESFTELPISTQSILYRSATSVENVEHIQQYSRKAGLLKTEEEVMGIVLKGVDADFDQRRFQEHLLEGQIPDFGNDSTKLSVLASRHIANKLRLSLGDGVLIYFVQDPPRARKISIAGIYETGIEDFDQQIVIGSNQLVKQLNSWPDTLTGGFEIFLSDFGQIDETFNQVYDVMDYDLQIEKVTDRYIHLFDWFLMVNQNVTIFLIIVLFVACFNIISIVLILIMERIQMIGTLKALGAEDKLIRRVFFFSGLRMTAWGLLIGNALAFGFAFLQSTYRLVPLDASNYYIDFVPIQFDFLYALFANLLVGGLVSLVLFFPTLFIRKVQPIEAIKFQ